jgi:NifU-like protein involved in Fe-S cluster formation
LGSIADAQREGEPVCIKESSVNELAVKCAHLAMEALRHAGAKFLRRSRSSPNRATYLGRTHRGA